MSLDCIVKTLQHSDTIRSKEKLQQPSTSSITRYATQLLNLTNFFHEEHKERMVKTEEKLRGEG